MNDLPVNWIASDDEEFVACRFYLIPDAPGLDALCPLSGDESGLLMLYGVVRLGLNPIGTV
jgi:hypothetical protein